LTVTPFFFSKKLCIRKRDLCFRKKPCVSTKEPWVSANKPWVSPKEPSISASHVLAPSLTENTSVLQCVAVCCSVLQCVAVCCRDREYKFTYYVVATISRLLKTIGLFWKRALQKRLYSAKETCNFKEPTNRSHPICGHLMLLVSLHKKLLQKSSSFAGSFICSRERSSCLPVTLCDGYDE